MTLDTGPIAVTGPLGFVAAHLLPRLAERGIPVFAIVRPGREAKDLQGYGNVEVRYGDLADPATLEGTFDGAELVVHLAGLALVPTFMPFLLSAGIRGGVFISSAGVHTRLPSPSADLKRTAEQVLRDSPLAYTILRPSMIYGTPRDRNVVRLLRWIDRWRVVPLPGGGVTLQQPVHVDDLVQAIVAALERPAAARGEYDVGGPEPISLREMVHASGRALGRQARVLSVPLKPTYAGALLARGLKLPVPVRPEQLMRLTESKAVDIRPAYADLGFVPRAFEEGIKAEVRMLRGELQSSR